MNIKSRYVGLVLGAGVTLWLAAPLVFAQKIQAIEELHPPGGVSQPAAPATSGTAKPRLPAAEERITRQERATDNQPLLEIMRRLDSLQTEVQKLRGEADVQAHELRGIKDRQRDLYLDIDRRLKQMEGTGVSAPQSSPGSAATEAPPEAQNSGERQAYEQAFNVLKDGRYEQAIQEFTQFLSRYPNGQYAANAQYWLSEAHYVSRHFQIAINEFRKLIDKYPSSPKLADAILKLGFAYYELSDWTQARNMLTAVVTRFPSSSAARLANNRLDKMTSEGH